ncbi:MAG: metallophosphoesterase [Solirubrobacterales bacterium]
MKKTFIFLLLILIIFGGCDTPLASTGYNGWAYSNNTWHYYQNGVMLKSGWARDSQGWCYLDLNGSWLIEGWTQDSAGWCYIKNGYWNGQPQMAEIPSQTTLRFVVMADSRGQIEGTINMEAVKKTLAELKKLSPQPSFAIIPGDLAYCKNTYNDTKAELLSFKKLITEYYPIDFYYPGFGNHEAAAGALGEKAFGEVFSEFNANFLNGYNRTVYYFDKNDLRFYMLNTNNPGEDHTISDIQLNWEKNNTNYTKIHNFYFFHEPAYPTGSHVGSSLDANKLQRDKLWKVIDASINPMVFCGHEHIYTRRHINSDFNETIEGEVFNYNKTIYQVTTGTFGAPIASQIYADTKDVDVTPEYEYHYTVVDVMGSHVQVTVFNLDGGIIDQFQQ